MQLNNYRPFFFIIFFVLSSSTFIDAQSSLPKLFIDCNCDINYLRQEINYVNHVRDQSLADIQLFIFDIRNASGGRKYDLNFEGKNQYADINPILFFESSPIMTRDEVRRGLLEKVELGLISFILISDIADQITFTIDETNDKEESEDILEDKWKFWIFELYGRGSLRKESSRSNVNGEFGFEGDKVTENWRIRIDAELNHSEERYQSDEEEFLVIRRFRYARGSIVRSLGNHWSAGIFANFSHSTYNNINFAHRWQPAIEFNIFPYEEVLRREITFAYKLSYLNNTYIEETIYNKMQEHLFNQSLDIEMRFRQPWGDISTNLEVSTFLHDFSKNRLEFDGRVSVRIFRGLSVQVSGNLDIIRDQINLPVGNASLEDILLQQRQIATDFEARASFGISYTFGSAFNNIINTRL
jgi:hypothetical protein